MNIHNLILNHMMIPWYMLCFDFTNHEHFMMIGYPKDLPPGSGHVLAGRGRAVRHAVQQRLAGGADADPQGHGAVDHAKQRRTGRDKNLQLHQWHPPKKNNPMVEDETNCLTTWKGSCCFSYFLMRLVGEDFTESDAGVKEVCMTCIKERTKCNSSHMVIWCYMKLLNVEQLAHIFYNVLKRS